MAATAERAVYIRVAVQDGDAAISALRNIGVQGQNAIGTLNSAAAQGGAAFKSFGDQVATAGKGFQLSYSQLEQLTGAVHHALDAIVAGQSPFRALEQQAVGLVGTFGGVALSIAAAAAPLLAVGAAIGAVALAGTQYEASVKAVATAVKATGDASGLSLAQMESLAQGVSAAGDLSVKAVRDIEVAATASGRLTGAVFSGVIDVAQDLGVALGKTATAAAGDLTKALQDPAKAAADLDKQLDFLTAAQLRQITLMAQAGNAAGAQGLLVDALGTRLHGLATGSMSEAGRAWASLTQAASNAWDAMGGKVAGAQTPEQRIAALAAQVKAAAAAANQGIDVVGDGSGPFVQDPVHAPSGLGTSGKADPSSVGANASTQLFTAQIGLHSQQERDQAAQDAAALATAQKAADAYAASLDTVTAAQNGLSGEQARLQGLVAAGADGDGRYAAALDVVYAKQTTLLTADQDSARQAAISAQVNAAAIGDRELLRVKLDAEWEAEKQVAAGHLDEANKQAYVTSIVQQATAVRSTAAATAVALDDAQAQSTIRVAAAMSQSLAASVDAAAAEQARTAKLKDSTVDEAALAAAIRQRVAADSLLSITTTVDGLKDQAAAALSLADAEGKGSAAVAEAARQNQVALFAKKALADADAQTIDQVKKEIADYDDLTKQILAANQAGQARKELLQSSNELTIAQAQFDLASALPDVRAREIAVLQKRLQLQQEGIAPESELGQQILANVDAAAKLNAAFQQAQQITGDIADAIATGLEEGGKNGIASFEDSLKRALIELAKNMLLTPLIQPVVTNIVGSVTGATASAGGSSSSGIGSLLQSGGSINQLTGGSLTSGLDDWASSTFPSLFGSGGIGGTALGDGIAADGGFGAELGGGVVGSGTSAEAGALGSSFSGAAGAGLAYAAPALVGFSLGSYFAGQNSGSKAPGALEGAGAGAAAGAVIGSVVPILGTAIGAIIGGVAGLIGGLLTPGYSVGPNNATNFKLNPDGTVGVYDARSDNGGNQAAAVADGTAVSTAINDFTTAIGGKISDTGGKVGDQVGNLQGNYFSTYGGVTHDYKDEQSANVDYVLRLLQGSTYSGVSDPNITTAIKNSKATSIDGLTSDAQFGANFDQTIKSLNGSFGVVDQTVQTAKASIDSTVTSLKAFEDQTAALGLPVDQAKSAVDSYVQSLLGLRAPVTDSAYDQAVRATTAEFAELQTQLTTLGYSATDAANMVNQGLTKALDNLTATAQQSFDAAVRAANGQGYIDDLTTIATNSAAGAADATAIGRDPLQLENAQLDQSLSNLDLTQAQQALQYFKDGDQTIEAAVQRRIDALNSEAAATDAATAASQALTDAQNQLAAGQTIRNYLTSLAGADGGGTPESALAADSSQFDSDLALSQAGDADALKAITNDAQALLAAGQAVYASGPQQQALIAYVEQSLAALPATVSYDQQQLTKLTVIAALQQASGDTLGSLQTLTAADTQSKLIVGSLVGVEAGVAGSIQASGLGTASAVVAAAAANGTLYNAAAGATIAAVIAAGVTNGAAVATAGAANDAAYSAAAGGTTAAVLAAGASSGTLFGLAAGGTTAAVNIAAGSNVSAIGSTTSAVLQLLGVTGSVNTGINTASFGIASVYGVLGSLGTLQQGTTAAVAALGTQLGSIAANTNTLVGLSDRINTSLQTTLFIAASAIITALKAIPATVVNVTGVSANVSTTFDRSGDNDAGGGNGGGFALGGVIVGPGTGTSDSIRARLSNGEFVVNAAGHRLAGTRLLQNINAGALPSPQGTQGSDPQTLDLLSQILGALKGLQGISADAGDGTAQQLAQIADGIGRIQKQGRLAATRAA